MPPKIARLLQIIRILPQYASSLWLSKLANVSPLLYLDSNFTNAPYTKFEKLVYRFLEGKAKRNETRNIKRNTKRKRKRKRNDGVVWYDDEAAVSKKNKN